MTRIRIDTKYAREIGRRIISEADYVAQIGNELQNAIGSLDTGAWDGRSRARAAPLLNRVRPENARLADELDRLGRKLVRVAEVFETEDGAAARNLGDLGWVDFTLGAGKVGSEGDARVGGTTGDTGTNSIGNGSSSDVGSKDDDASDFELKGGVDFKVGDDKKLKPTDAEVKAKLIDGELYDAEDVTGDVKVGDVDLGDYKLDAKAGTYEAGAKVGLGEDGFTAGAYGEVGAGEATAEGVIGNTALGVAAAGTVAGPKAECFIGIKDNTLGASIGGSIVSAEAEAGLNIAGANVGVKGGLSLGLEFGFKIGQETEVKFGPFKIGLSFGKAKDGR